MPNAFDQFDATQANPFDQFDPAVNPSAQSPAGQAVGLAKQAGSSILENIAAMPGAIPKGLKEAGSAVSQWTGLPEAQPILGAPQTDAFAPYLAALPQPQSEAEELARSYGAFPLIGLTEKGRIGENIAGGIGAGAGSYIGSQVAPSLGASSDVGSIGGALLGGYAGARGEGIRENAVARQNMPSPQEVLNAADDAYTTLRRNNKAIVLPADQMSMIKTGTLNLLKSFGPDEADAKEVYSIVKNLGSSDYGPGTVADLINARKNLKSHFQGGPDANKPAASIALQVMDSIIDKTGSPGTLAELKKSDANWSAARTAQAVDTKISQAQDRAEGANSGLNTGNNIIQNINSYIKSRTDLTGKVHLAPSDLDALNQARKLNIGQEVTRHLSNLAGGGGGLGALAVGGVSALSAKGANEAGYNLTEQDPLLGGLGIPALGLLGRYGFNRSVARAAKNAEASILARSPYAQSLGVSSPRPLLSGTQVGGRSLLFAAPALRDLLTSSAQ